MATTPRTIRSIVPTHGGIVTRLALRAIIPMPTMAATTTAMDDQAPDEASDR
jgi:hypothetical protein